MLIMSSKEKAQILTKFTTKEKKYEIPDNPFSIQITATSIELNSIIKEYLKEVIDNNKDDRLKDLELIEFDFIVNNELLLTTLEEYLNQNPHIKTESVIEIEYVLQIPPPEPKNSLVLGDWVSCVRGYDDLILAASYDHTVQLWDLDGNQLVIIPGHSGAVKAVSWIQSDVSNGVYKFISASHDQSLMIWQYKKDKKSVENVVICVGHKESVECVDVDQKSTKFVSGSWDCMLKLWSLEEEPISDEKESKLNKKTPIITLAGHQQNISCCKWMDNVNVCTASWDHTIRLWDMHAAQEKCTLSNNSKIFLSIDYSNLNNLIIAGLNDRHIRLYDPRSNEGTLVKATFTSHTGWGSSVSWSKTNQNIFVTGSYDCLLKLWDTRSPKAPIYDITGHEDKVFSVDWSLKNYILSGSADNNIKIFKSSS